MFLDISHIWKAGKTLSRFSVFQDKWEPFWTSLFSMKKSKNLIEIDTLLQKAYNVNVT